MTRRIAIACLVAALLSAALVWWPVAFNCAYFPYDPFCWWYS